MREGVDWPAFLSYARNHQLDGILYSQCRKSSPAKVPGISEALDRLGKAYASSIYYSANLQSNYQKLRMAFLDAGIPFIPIKGIAIAQYYPEPLLRTMGDVDLLMRAEDQPQVREIMSDLGYQNTLWSEEEWNYSKQNSHYELHRSLIHGHIPGDELRDTFFDRFWEYAAPVNGGSEYRLDRDFHFLFLLLHISHHMRREGIGFRQFYDLSVLIRNASDLFDWARIQEMADSLDLLTFVKTCLAFCERWFRIQSPIRTDPLDDAFFEAATETVFANGVFGFQNEEHRLYDIEKAARESALPFPLLKLKASVGLLFPPYWALSRVPKYGFLQGKPYLLPAAWVYRIFVALTQKKNRGRAMLKSTLTASSEAVSSRSNLLSQWGL